MVVDALGQGCIFKRSKTKQTLFQVKTNRLERFNNKIFAFNTTGKQDICTSATLSVSLAQRWRTARACFSKTTTLNHYRMRVTLLFSLFHCSVIWGCVAMLLVSLRYAYSGQANWPSSLSVWGKCCPENPGNEQVFCEKRWSESCCSLVYKIVLSTIVWHFVHNRP